MTLPPPSLLALLACAALAAGCKREEREFQAPAALSRRPTPPTGTGLVPGAADRPDAPAGGPADEPLGDLDPRNSFQVGEGQRLYDWFNCGGCHGHGGGGNIGPPLMNGRWRYGGEPGDVYRSIAGGRPNGMPAFGQKVPEEQIWQLVAYVRAMSGMIPQNARPGRSESLSPRAPDTTRSPEPPVRGDEPGKP